MWINNYNNGSMNRWNYKQRRNNFNKYSAGILPYTFDSNGKCFFLCESFRFNRDLVTWIYFRYLLGFPKEKKASSNLYDE